MTEKQIDRMTSGACIMRDGNICKSGEFTSRMTYKDSKYKPSESELEKITDLFPKELTHII